MKKPMEEPPAASLLIAVAESPSASSVVFEEAIGVAAIGTAARRKSNRTWGADNGVVDHLQAPPRAVPENPGPLVGKLETTLFRLEQRIGRQATMQELSTFAGVDLEEYLFMLEQAYPVPLFTFKDSLNDPPAGPAYRLHRYLLDQSNFQLTDAFLIEVLAEGITLLPEPQRLVVTLSHQEKMATEEIAYLLHLAHSEVRQLHSQAMVRLRVALRKRCTNTNRIMQ